jgi:hypothetical protein
MTYRGQIKNGVAILDSPVELPDGTRVQIVVEQSSQSDFWKNKTVEQLAVEQGVKPIKNLADLKFDWPADDSIDDLLALVREVRH